MKSGFLIIFIVLTFCAPVFAGDYTLVISDDPLAPCTEQAHRAQKACEERQAAGEGCRGDLNSPIHTTNEVVESLNLYFSGQKPKITILLPAFSNGHMTFCTKREKQKIYKALKAIRATGKACNKRHLDDFIRILGIEKRKDGT